MKSLDQVTGLVLLFLALLLQFFWIIPWLLSSGNLFGLLAGLSLFLVIVGFCGLFIVKHFSTKDKK